MHSRARWRWSIRFQRLPLIMVLAAIPAGQAAMAAEAAEDDAIARKVAVIELSRSIRSYTVGILATADCLVREGRLSRREADQAVPIQLREMGISPHVVNNPQVVRYGFSNCPETTLYNMEKLPAPSFRTDAK